VVIFEMSLPLKAGIICFSIRCKVVVTLLLAFPFLYIFSHSFTTFSNLLLGYNLSSFNSSITLSKPLSSISLFSWSLLILASLKLKAE